MTNLHKSRPYIFAFLLFCVASSKHIIIYNEELLVSGIFLAFVIYVQKAFGTGIQSYLDDSRNSILQELQSLANHKKESLEHLKILHEKVFNIETSLKTIEKYIYNLVSQIGNIATKSINQNTIKGLKFRLLQAKSSSQNLLTSYQQRMSDSFLPTILVYTQTLTKEKNAKNSNSSAMKEQQNLKTTKRGISLLLKAKI